MLDVTIIGWGEDSTALELSPTETKHRWWWVIPHLGKEFGIPYDSAETGYTLNSVEEKGFMKFNRRFDDCLIESQAVGPVPYNFIPTQTSEGN